MAARAGTVFSRALCLALAWFAACGGTTGRRGGTLDDASGGEAGEPSRPAQGGGSALQPGGAPAQLPEQPGAGGQPDHAAGAGGFVGAPAADGGAAGRPPLASGGEPGVSAGASAGGAPASGGEGGAAEAGAGGAAAVCCEPLTCQDMLGGYECAQNPFRDDCGRSFFCGCADGDECVDNQCITCDPGAAPCAAEPNLCGQTHDRCGNPLDCSDNCQALLGALGICHDGQCCEVSKTSCDVDDCGYMSDGCGGFVDCTSNVCANDVCQPNGKCCTPTRSCLSDDCGYIDDGCGNYLNCGEPCDVAEACLDNQCHPSACKPDLDCGSVYNPYVDGFEFCGTSCGPSQACLEHVCVPLCTAPVE